MTECDKVEKVRELFPQELDYALRALMNESHWMYDEEIKVKELHDGDYELYVGIRRNERT